MKEKKPSTNRFNFLASQIPPPMRAPRATAPPAAAPAMTPILDEL
jgi:hypothetical protein